MNHAPLLLVVLATTLAACQDSGGCVEISRTAVTDPQTPLHIGGTYGEVLATVVGERSGTLRWLETEQFVRGFPSSSETRITVTIHEPSMAWDVETESHTGRNERLLCLHGLETELEIELKSDDGVLDMKMLVPVTFDSPSSMSLANNITEQDIGAQEFDPINEDASLLMMLSYQSDREPEGSLVLRTVSSDDSGSGVGMTVDLATWTLE